ncbi:MFS transporter [Phaeovulum sp. W22_SRMD_FR3]|uniref:MFS transporter n=1 Tax=Phaeovulum sp. W22_SRMD_FR3 TaxID=3240274 RepID=UPI003F9E5EEF
MTQSTTRAARLALIIGHIAGMVDLSALPVWVDTLISGYGYRPLVAGALPSVFLLGAVAASVLIAQRFGGANGRRLAPLGYAVAAVSMLAVPVVELVQLRLALHLVAGICIGVSLSLVHGTMGKTANPHRTFAHAYVGFGVFSLIFLGGVPQLTQAFGPNAFFYAIAAVFGVAAGMTLLFMPSVVAERRAEVQSPARLSRRVRLAIAGFTLMSLIQAMVFSFLVQAGSAHGFAAGQLQLMLVVLGVVNLLPGMAAALLEKRLKAMNVAKMAPLAQAACASVIMMVALFPAYGIAAILFPAIQVFTHTFVFGFLARNDASGRATAATPAMIMAGSAVAPFIGGALVEMAGFAAIGAAAICIGLISAILFRLAERDAPAALAEAPHGA